MAVAVAVTVAPGAAAVEREHHLGADAGGSVLVVGDKSGADVGPAFGAHWAYGVTDAFNAMVEATFSLVAPGEKAQNARTPMTRPASVSSVSAGVGYVLDVLRWVPYGGALVGGSVLSGGTIAGAKVLPCVVLAAGLDYRFGRSWAAGVALREHLLVTDMSTYPSFTQLFARFEYTLGW
jgi:hypothetical protein